MTVVQQSKIWQVIKCWSHSISHEVISGISHYAFTLIFMTPSMGVPVFPPFYQRGLCSLSLIKASLKIWLVIWQALISTVSLNPQFINVKTKGKNKHKKINWKKDLAFYARGTTQNDIVTSMLMKKCYFIVLELPGLKTFRSALACSFLGSFDAFLLKRESIQVTIF